MSVPQIRTVQQILQIASISEYLAYADIANQRFYRGSAIDNSLPLMISAEKKSVQWMYDYNPTNSTLQGTANYLFGLLGKYATQAQIILDNLAQSPPVVTGASDQSAEDGDSVTFSVGVTSVLPYTIQWYSQSGLVPGANNADYTFTATLADNGNTYYAIVSSAAGSTQSNTGTLTVTNTILLYAYYTDSDPHADLLAGIDNFSYQFTVNVTHNQPISIPIPQVASNNKYWVWKVVSTEQDNNTWFSTGFNSGQIPDSTFYDIIKFGGNSYYSLRNASSFDYTVPLILSKV